MIKKKEIKTNTYPSNNMVTIIFATVLEALHYDKTGRDSVQFEQFIDKQKYRITIEKRESKEQQEFDFNNKK